MAYLLAGQCTIQSTSNEQTFGQRGCTIGDNLVPPSWATGVSWWYETVPGNNANCQVLAYDTVNNPWSLQHSAVVPTTWASWQQAVVQGRRYTWTCKNGNGAPVDLRISWYSGTYSAAQDPANPAVTPHNPCEYGTEKQPTAQAVQYLTPALIDLVLSRYGLTSLSILFDGLWFSILNVDELCGSLPPPFPPVDLGLLTASPTVKMDLFKSLAWGYFCQCKSGTPAPTPPPPPSGTIPPDWPSYPTVPCADTDLCAALVALQRQVGAIQNQLLEIKGITFATQRFGVPFGFNFGTAHKLLSGEGTFTVSRLVGLQVLLNTVPAGTRVLDSEPDYVWGAGWVSVSSPDGMLQQRRVARQSMVWLPPGMQDATVVGYHASPGFIFDIVELGPEP